MSLPVETGVSEMRFGWEVPKRIGVLVQGGILGDHPPVFPIVKNTTYIYIYIVIYSAG